MRLYMLMSTLSAVCLMQSAWCSYWFYQMFVNDGEAYIHEFIQPLLIAEMIGSMVFTIIGVVTLVWVLTNAKRFVGVSKNEKIIANTVNS